MEPFFFFKGACTVDLLESLSSQTVLFREYGKSETFERLIYWAISTDSLAEYLSLSNKSVSYIHDIVDAPQIHAERLIDSLFVQ